MGFGQLQQLLGDPAGDVEKGGLGEALVHPSDIAAQQPDDMPGQLRMTVDEGDECLPFERQAFRQIHRLGVRRPGRVVLEER